MLRRAWICVVAFIFFFFLLIGEEIKEKQTQNPVFITKLFPESKRAVEQILSWEGKHRTYDLFSMYYFYFPD